jgi:site-specific DNA-methyltransferase (adenine-specific)
MMGITCEDCMELMARYPDKYFDLAIVDPPYGILDKNDKTFDHYCKYPQRTRLSRGAGKLKNRALQTMDSSFNLFPPKKEYFTELFRVAKYPIIWGGNYFDLPPSRCWIAWDKIQPWENFSQIELAWTPFDKPAALFRHATSGALNGEIKIHPTQKPVALYKWLLTRYAKPGWKILDTHLGSGSIAIACHDLGFDLTACEIDRDYYNAAMERIREYQRQLTLNFEEGEHGRGK